MSHQYGVIVADPPWPKRKGGLRAARPNQGRALDYPTLSLEQIFCLVDSATTMTAEKHNVFIWVVDEFLHEAEQAMGERGYKLHARILWDKGNGVAPAFTVRFSHEYLLWFFKPGAMLLPAKEQRGKWTTVLREDAARPHSTKPEAGFAMLQAMFPEAAKLEMFARRKREGWHVWGNEVESDIQL